MKISQSVRQWAAIPQQFDGRWHSIGGRRPVLMNSGHADEGYRPPMPPPPSKPTQQYPRSPGFSVNERLPEGASNLTYTEFASYMKEK
jgi:hypothetical protein